MLSAPTSASPDLVGAPPTARGNPYDELPYRSRPIEWSAPERLALCSLLHGGPRVRSQDYRVLELGCGDGANLIPLAYYRRNAVWLGVDASQRAIDGAESRRRALRLDNLSFVLADFTRARERLSGPFDYILVHGVFSWVAPDARDCLLDLCSELLAPGGLLYLNYNARPGWNVRGLVRDFLRAQSAHGVDLAERTRVAQAVAAAAAAALADLDHPYARLMHGEYTFVSQGHPSYVAHEFLAPENHAYWRSEVLAMARARGLHYVADADFNYDSGRTADDLLRKIEGCGWQGMPAEDTADLFCYRQLHSAVFSPTPARSAASDQELAQLYLAAPLAPLGDRSSAAARFRHPSGHEVEARDASMSRALARAAACWPRGTRVAALFDDVTPYKEDLLLLQRHAMIELRTVEPEQCEAAAELALVEQRAGGYCTDPYHRYAETPSPEPAFPRVAPLAQEAAR